MNRSLATLILSLFYVLAFGQNEREINLDVRFITNNKSLPDHAVQAALRDLPSWQSFSTANPGWWVEFNEMTGIPHRAAGKPIEITHAGSPEQIAQAIFNNELASFGIDPGSLTLKSFLNGGKYQIFNMVQTHEGLELLFSDIKLRLTQDNKLVLFGLDYHPEIDLSVVPSLYPAAAAASAISDIPFTVEQTEVSPNLKVLPIARDGKFDYHLVYEVRVLTTEDQKRNGDFYTVVDANDGQILYRQNRVHNCGPMPAADITAEATVVDNPLFPSEVRGLPYLRVDVDGETYYTDANGILDLPEIDGPTTATLHLEGPYAEVYRGNSSTDISSFEISIDAGTNTISFDGEAENTEIAGYYHTNIVHDYMKSWYPSFNDLDFPVPVRVDRTDGDCNAFFDGEGINFYAPGGGCPATALFGDVIYHEYGHGINYAIYDYFGGFFSNGALGEAYSDVWGLGISENPILGQGFQGTPGSDVRRYDINPKVYPQDLVGQVHADGEIIAGAWWDYGQNIGSVQDMVALWTLTQEATANASDGNEGVLYRDILLDALLYDDDDADISNGTPNDEAIITAFGIHGITLLANANVVHPGLATTAAGEAINIEAVLDVDFPAYLGDFLLFWRERGTGAYSSVSMSNTSDDNYLALLPAQEEGTVLEYYFEVTDNYDGVALRKPAGVIDADPNLAYFTMAGYTLRETEDFDNFFGDWIVDPFGDDNAGTGIWEFDSPVQTISGSYVAQPGTDHTTEGANLNLCAFTGNSFDPTSLGANDVDDGKTTLMTPSFDLREYEDPIIAYHRWFTNDPPSGANPGNDFWVVRISDDGTNWVDVELTKTSDNSWRRNLIKVKDYVDLTESVNVIFIASDSLFPGSGLEFDGGSLVEAAIDDVLIYDLGEVENPTGLDDDALENLSISVFPNPATGPFSVFLNGQFNQDITIRIMNALGQSLYEMNINQSNSNRINIPDLGLSDGLYFVELTSGDFNQSRSVLINKH